MVKVHQDVTGVIMTVVGKNGRKQASPAIVRQVDLKLLMLDFQ